jgi:hypothetical protein
MPKIRKNNNSYSSKPPGHWITQVHPHDVLNGRGVSIAQHPGNLRFRALIKSHADQSYCAEYSAPAKKALAEGIIQHIHNLKPPGRFLRRPARSKNKGDVEEGVWEEMNDKDALKKTCQALRDCNRGDRTGYADAIEPPVDVQASYYKRQTSGLTKQEYAEQVAKGNIHPIGPPSAADLTAPIPAGLWADTTTVTTSLRVEIPEGVTSSSTSSAFTPKQQHTITPATVASTGEFNRFPDHHDDDSEDGHLPDGIVHFQHPFDAFTHSSNDVAVAIDYNHFDVEEEQKLTAMARQSASLDGQFDDTGSVQGRDNLEATADFSTLFDRDHFTM